MFFSLIVLPALYGLGEYLIHRYPLHERIGTTIWRRHALHHLIQRIPETEEIARDNKIINAFVHSLPFIYFVPSLFSLFVCYACYEFYHTELHRMKGRPERWFYRSRAMRYHMYHHSIPHYDKNYGVLTPFWDRVFGTGKSFGTPKWKYLYNWHPLLFVVNF